MNIIKSLNESKKLYSVDVPEKLNKGFYAGISTNDALIGKVIKTYSHRFEKIQKEYLASHAFVVFDGTVYESNKLGNQERHISKYIKNGHEFWLFTHPHILKSNLEKAQAYAKGALGRMYDYPGFVRFLITWMPQLKYADFCSEYMATVIQAFIRVPFLPDYKPADISPARALRYFMCQSDWLQSAHYKEGKPV